MKRFFIKTYGCQMNFHDTEVMAGILKKSGYIEASLLEDAELIILNTCSIREKAAHKVYSDLGRIKKLKDKNPELTIGVGGCVGKQEGKRIRSRAPWVDVVFGPDELKKVALFKEKFKLELDAEEKIYPERESSTRAWVTIMHGCNNFCSYCVVPYTRGRETSKPPEEIVEEITMLAGKGFQEVILLGQNVNSYAHMEFYRLLHLVHEIDGINRIKFMSSHPKDFSIELVKTIAELPKVGKCVHLPMQSASDRILLQMNRKYTFSEYMEKVENIRKHIPDGTLTSDIIVGFPGETDEDYLKTEEAIKEIRFDYIHPFMFSKRPNTKALDMDGHIEKDVKEARINRLVDVQKEISLSINRKYIDQKLEVLVEGASRKNPDKLTGRTMNNLIVNFTGSQELIGKYVLVTITDATSICVYGKI